MKVEIFLLGLLIALDRFPEHFASRVHSLSDFVFLFLHLSWTFAFEQAFCHGLS
jgi:hypothetical protein